VLLDETESSISSDAFPEGAYPVSPPEIPGYEIGPELGRGGFGVVFSAEQRTPVERRVAIKVLRTEFASMETIERFKGEAGVLARMNHESIAHVFDAGVDHLGRPFVVMELIEGESFIKACKRMKLSLRDRIELLIRVCDAVHHAHQRAVIHRDLKPANVLVEETPNGARPRVIDFGIAKLLDDQASGSITREHIRLGTPRYMSPQQRQGIDTADTRVDVYALGAMLCEVLTGDVPNAPEPAEESKQTRRRRSGATRPSEIAAAGEPEVARRSREIKGDLDRVILKATADDPSLRYNSAAALGNDLRRYLDGLTISATPPGVSYVARKFFGRHRYGASLAMLSCISILAAFGIALLGWQEAKVQRDSAIVSSTRVAFIGEFLIDSLLMSTDVDVRGAPPAMSDGTLQKIADRAYQGLSEDPEHMLTLLTQIAKIQSRYGDTPAGVRTLRGALGFAIERYGIPSEQVVDLRVRLYDMLWAQGLTGSKDQILLASEEGKQLYLPDDPRMLRISQRTANTIESLEQIIERYENMDGIDPTDHYLALFALSMRYRFSQTPERQVDIDRRLYEIALQSFGPSSATAIDAMGNYGEVLAYYQPSEEAEQILRDALDRSTAILGYEHFATETIRRSLAKLIGDLGHPLDAIELANEGVRIASKMHGDDSIRFANALGVLGQLYAQAGINDLASENLSQALELSRKQWSIGHSKVTSIEVLLSKVLLEMGDQARADELVHSALGYMDPAMMASQIVSAVEIRVKILRANGQSEAADELIDETVTRLQDAGADQPAVDRLLAL